MLVLRSRAFLKEAGSSQVRGCQVQGENTGLQVTKGVIRTGSYK